MFGALSVAQKYLIIGLFVAFLAVAAGWGIHATYLRAVIASQKGTIAEQEGTIANLKANIKIVEGANATLSASIDTQNSKIKGWLDAVDARQKAADLALAKAKAEGEKWRKRTQQLLDSPPTNPAAECESLNARIDQYLDLRGEQ
jgi:hypothetical protein